MCDRLAAYASDCCFVGINATVVAREYPSCQQNNYIEIRQLFNRQKQFFRYHELLFLPG
jgi:hypothetical protein